MGDYSIMGHLICSITVHPPSDLGQAAGLPLAGTLSAVWVSAVLTGSTPVAHRNPWVMEKQKPGARARSSDGNEQNWGWKAVEG